VLSRPDHSLWPLFGLSLDHLTNIDTGNTHEITTPQDLGVVHLLTATFYDFDTCIPTDRHHLPIADDTISHNLAPAR
jgi:hypothetical protein